MALTPLPHIDGLQVNRDASQARSLPLSIDPLHGLQDSPRVAESSFLRVVVRSWMHLFYLAHANDLRSLSHAQVLPWILFSSSARTYLNCRVRCDLKDLPVSKNGHQSQCSNCKERDLKCMYVILAVHVARLSYCQHHLDSDEFAEVKAVKLLRRGRRLQQVE